MHFLVATTIALINLPFGFWRARVRRFSPAWFVAVHAPVPLAIGVRLAAGLGWQVQTILLSVSAFFAGQFLGGKLSAVVQRPRPEQRLRASDPAD